MSAEHAHSRIPARDIVGVVISLIALAAVVWWAANQPTPKFPDTADRLALIFAAVALYAVATFARGWRWHVILRRSHIRHSPLDACELVAVGYMGNTVLPARGGEVLRILLMADRSGARRREILGSIIAERLLDVVALVLLFAPLTWIGVGGAPAGQAPAAIALGLAVAGVVAVAIYLRMRRAGAFQRFADRVRPVARMSRPMFGPTGAALAALSVAIWVLEGVIFFLVGHSLELDFNLVDGTFLVVLGSFFALVPAAPGYVGTFDAAVLFGLAALDVRGGAAVGFALLVRFVLFVPITLAGLAFLLARFGGIKRARAMLRADREHEHELHEARRAPREAGLVGQPLSDEPPARRPTSL